MLSTIMMCLILLAAVYCLMPGLFKSTSSRSAESSPLFSSVSRAVDNGALKRGALGSSEYLYQAPPSPRGMLFLAHGCGHQMQDWWFKTPSVCSDCFGLPEEVAIVELAMKHNLVAVAMSSVGPCWSVEDGARVARIMIKLEKDYTGPMFAFGASSGGNFVASILPKAIKDAGGNLSGFISQIMATEPADADIPAVYITMNRDKRTDQAASEIVKSLQSRKVSSRHVRLAPIPVSRHYFSDRIANISDSKSDLMVKDLSASNILDSSSMLIHDPRVSEWRRALEKHRGEDSLIADKSPISEVMNVAWAMHEISRDSVDESLQFLWDERKTNLQ
jgi:hypothetical protein